MNSRPTESAARPRNILLRFRDEFSGASLLEKFRVLADLFTVLGISVATLISLPLVSELLGQEFYLVDFLATIFFYSIFLLVVLGSVVGLSSALVTAWKERDFFSVIYLLLVLLVFITLCAWVAPKARYLVGATFDISYMLPEAAQTAVSDVADVTAKAIYGDGSKVAITGHVIFKHQANPADYVVIAYRRRAGETYFQHVRDTEIDFEIAKNGEFEIGGFQIAQMDSHSEMFLAIVRKADRAFLPPFYPANLLNSSASSLQALRPYIVSSAPVGFPFIH